MRPTEKRVPGQHGFLHDLERRESETRRTEPRPAPRNVRRDTIVEAESREVSGRDSRA